MFNYKLIMFSIITSVSTLLGGQLSKNPDFDQIKSYYQPLKGGRMGFLLPLSESYEYQILDGKGALNYSEYKKYFAEEGIEIEHVEIYRELMTFKSEEELKKWLEKEVLEGNLDVIDDYMRVMKERGWLNFGDGYIRFPRQRLIVIPKRPL